jgi:hypothetical protein
MYKEIGKNLRYIMVPLIILLGLSLYAGCDKRNPTEVNEEPTAEETVQYMTLTAEPEEKEADKGESDCTLKVKLLSESSLAIVGAEVEFKVLNNIGIVSTEDTATNAKGEFIAVFEDLGDTGTAMIEAKSGQAADTASVKIRAVDNQIDFKVDNPFIFASKQSETDITAELRNTFGQIIIGKPIDFKTSLGSISPPIDTTDSNGEALVTLQGVPGDTGRAVIVGSWGQPGNYYYTVETTYVDIEPVRDVSSIDLNLTKTEIHVGGNDSAMVIATVKDSTGSLALDGTLITFSVDGNGFASPDTGTTVTGITSTYVKAGNSTDTLLVTARHGDVTDTASIVVTPTGPQNIFMTLSDSSLTVSSGETAIVYALVVDSFSNHVQDGTEITFDHTLGSGQVTGRSQTVNGVATAIYTVGNMAGLDTIRAKYDDTTLVRRIVMECRSANANQLTLSASPRSITVRGAGGQSEASTITAFVKDANQNPVDSTEVIFRIISSPPSDSVNGKAHFITPGTFEDTSLSIDGYATTNLVSGDHPGTVTIGARTADIPEVSGPLVTVHSGPPAYISIGPGQTENQGGTYRWELSATVRDIHANAVVDSTAVYFSADPGSVMTIMGGAFTGNTSNEGYTIAGTAFTNALYNCMAVFDTVTIIAQSGDVVGTLPNVVIPISDDAILTLDANPGNILLYTNSEDSGESHITVQLYDEMVCPISKGRIRFGVENAGHIGPDEDTTDVDGMAETWFWIWKEEIESPDTPPQVTATVKAWVVRNPTITTEIDIRCRKVSPPPPE